MHPFGILSPERFAVVDIETSEGFDCEEAFGHGRFQNGLTLFTLITIWAVTSHTLAFSLISAEVDHWCRQPNDVNISANAWKNIGIPIEADGRRSRCMVFANPGDPNDTKIVDCDAWEYDPQLANSSIVPEWNLVCNRRSLKALARGVFMAAALVFLALSGCCADRFGRLPVVLTSACVVLVATAGCCFAKSYSMYVGARFLVSGCTLSLYAVTATVLAESCSFASRPTLLSFTTMTGLMLAETCFIILKHAPHLGWFLLQLIMVAPTLLLPVGIFLVAESPRWLIASRRLEAAERVMLAAAKSNGGNQDRVALLLQRVEQRLQSEEVATNTSMLATDMARVVRRRAVIMFGSSFSVMAAFYTLLLYHAERRTAAAWIEWAPLCANALACVLLLKIVNRMDKTRLITSTFLILGSLCCFASIAMLTAGGKPSFKLVADVVLVMARAASSVALVFNFVYLIELFPTPFRGVAGCLSLASGRLGGMVGALFLPLARISREDLLFLLIAAAVCSSAYSFQYLPLEYGTYARLVDAEASVTAVSNKRKLNPIDAMKQSLADLPTKKHDSTRGRPSISGRKRSPSVASRDSRAPPSSGSGR